MVLLNIDVEIPEDTPVDVEINLPILDDEPIPYKPKSAEKTLSFVYYWTTGHVHFDVEKKKYLSKKLSLAILHIWTILLLITGVSVRVLQWRPPLRIFVLHTRK